MRHATGNFSIQTFNLGLLFACLMSVEAKAAPAQANEAAYRKVGDAYEALMLRNLYQQMQTSNGIGQMDPDSPFAPSNAERIFRSMRDEAVIQDLAKRHPLGISDMVVRQLQGKGGVRIRGRVESKQGQ